jgi:ADYC domain
MDALDLAETEQAVKPQPGDDDGCPPWACGSNSPQIDFNAFHELYKLNLANAEGYRITAFRKLISNVWQPFYADVINGELVAKSSAGTVIYSGAQVEGMAFTIMRGSLTYYMTVFDVSRMSLWAKINGLTRVTPTYRFTWSTVLAPGTVGTNVCGVNTDGDGMADFYAVLFESDRIDADAIRVVGETPGWFNIGCAGHALAKQHLTGNTRAAAAIMGGAAPTLNQRTAQLKMISGDYCGGGDPFTVAGQPLAWKDALGRFNTTDPLNPAMQIEARWNQTGAICLNTPRVDSHHTMLGDATFIGGVEPLLAPSAGWCTGLNGSHVRPPLCSPNQSDFQGAYLISVNK